MNCPKCGEVCHCLTEPPPNSLPIHSMAETEPELAATDAAPGDEASSAWRGELAARLSRYRARRKAPPPRYPSLKLPFGVGESSVRTATGDTFNTISNQALALEPKSVEPSVVEEPGSAVAEAVPTPAHASAKIIEFP